MGKSNDYKPVIIPMVKISGQGITLFNHYEGLRQKEPTESKIKLIFCAFQNSRPKSPCNFYRKSNDEKFLNTSENLCSNCVYIHPAFAVTAKKNEVEHLSAKIYK